MKDWADFRAVKEAVSLEAVLRHYQVAGLRRRRDQLAGRGPIHQGTRDDSFRAHLGKNAFRCFACQAGGNVLDLVAAMERCSIRDAALRLQQWFGVSRSLGPAAGPQLARWPQRQAELVRERNRTTPRSGSHYAVWIPITRTWNTGDSRLQPPSSSASVSMAGPACLANVSLFRSRISVARSSPMPAVQSTVARRNTNFPPVFEKAWSCSIRTGRTPSGCQEGARW